MVIVDVLICIFVKSLRHSDKKNEEEVRKTPSTFIIREPPIITNCPARSAVEGDKSQIARRAGLLYYWWFWVQR